jgi:phage tail-like protein
MTTPVNNSQLGSAKQIFGQSSFEVKIPDIDPVGVFRECHGLELSFEVLTYHEGGNNDLVHQFPSRASYPNLILSRGVTDEDALLRWLWQTRTKAERKEVIITLHDWGQKTKRSWSFADAFPVRWTGPLLSAESNDLATESLEIAHSGLLMA